MTAVAPHGTAHAVRDAHGSLFKLTTWLALHLRTDNPQPTVFFVESCNSTRRQRLQFENAMASAIETRCGPDMYAMTVSYVRMADASLEELVDRFSKRDASYTFSPVRIGMLRGMDILKSQFESFEPEGQQLTVTEVLTLASASLNGGIPVPLQTTLHPVQPVVTQIKKVLRNGVGVLLDPAKYGFDKCTHIESGTTGTFLGTHISHHFCPARPAKEGERCNVQVKGEFTDWADGKMKVHGLLVSYNIPSHGMEFDGHLTLFCQDGITPTHGNVVASDPTKCTLYDADGVYSLVGFAGSWRR